MVRSDVTNSYHGILTIDYYKFDFYYKFWLSLFKRPGLGLRLI